MNKRSAFFHSAQVTHCGQALVVGGQVFEPDADLAYVDGVCGFGLPSVNSFGQAMLAPVIARSAATWARKMVNIGHLVKSYGAPGDILRDRIVGHVAGWEFPPEPEGGWKIPADRAAAPGCRLALAIFKAAEMVPGLFGKAQTGREHWTLSMEVRWHLSETAFAWKKTLLPVAGAVPLADGWEALPWDRSPAELRACFDDASNSVVRRWGGRDPVLLLGGLLGTVEFKGVALVNEGHEPTARIRHLLAGRLDGALPEAGPAGGLDGLAGTLELVRLNAALRA